MALKASLLTSFLAILTLTSALPVSDIASTTCTKTCSTFTVPKDFTASNYMTFSPAAGNTATPPRVSFALTTFESLSCSATSTSASGIFSAVCTGGSDPNVKTTFEYNGSTKGLTVVIQWVDCASSHTMTLTGNTTASTYCYPTQPPQPQGFGTQCQAPGHTAAFTVPFGNPVIIA